MCNCICKKERKNEIDIHLEHLPEDVLKGIAEKAENKIGNYDTVEIYPNAPIQEILSGDKNGKDYHQELFEKIDCYFWRISQSELCKGTV